MRRLSLSGRPAVTLIELMVIIAIIGMIVGLGVLVVPGLLKSEKSSRGAGTLQGSLLIAKQQALRDRVPYGIRLIVDADAFVRSFRYIHQPDDFTGGTIQVEAVDPSNPSTPPLTTALISKDPTGGLANPALWPVQVGDFLQVQSEQPVRITNITQVNATAWRLYLNSPPALSAVATSDYRIIRRPRPAAGEEIIELPEDVIIDLPASLLTPDPGPPATYDIVFAPAGAILGPSAINGKIILWVRDITQNPATTDEQTLIVVYTRSGRIASFAVDINPPAGGGPFSFVTQSPRGSGQ